MNLPVLGFRVNNFTYITDANKIPQSEMEKIRGSEVIALNALRKEKHISHFNLEEAIVQAGKIGAEQTYFTHISHKMGLHQSVSKEMPDSIALAHDGLTVTL